MHTFRRYLSLVLALLTVGAFSLSCTGTQTSASGTDTQADTTLPVDTTTAAPESTTDTEPAETTAAEIETTAEESSSAPESTTEASETTDTTAAEANSDEEETLDAPEFVNPLTGLAVESDLSALRPAAIMINNIKVSCPQMGVSQADIMYECLVEGGYTRLMMLVMDYANLPVVGSVRSARDYYLDFAADYDALFVHAGGSPFAYESIRDKSITNLDGVNMYLPTTFYRDQDRIVSMGLVHSLMTTGPKIVEGINYKKYRTEITEDFDYPLDFVKYGTEITFDDAAAHIRIPYSIVQTSDFIYDEDSGEYLRTQFGGDKHIDGATGEQLSYKNCILIFCETGLISGDAANRIDVGTIGEGDGYYATNGSYIPIKWKKDAYETPMQFFTADGEALLVNAGKTFISVCATNIKSLVSFNAK